MKTTITALLLLLTSCSTSERTAPSTIKKTELHSEKEFDDIENSDFDAAVTAEKYVPNKDRYQLPDVTLNKAQQESTALVATANLEALADADPFAELMNECRFGDLAKFKGRVQKIKKTYVKNPAFWNVIATCFIHKKDWPKAKVFLERSLSVVKDYSPAMNNYGIFQSQTGEDEIALQIFQKVAIGSNVVPKINLATLYLKYYHAANALKTLDSIQGNPHWKVGALKATAYFMLGDVEKALHYFRGAAGSAEFEKSNLNVNYALSLLKSGKQDEARDQYLKGADHYELSQELMTSVQKALGI